MKGAQRVRRFHDAQALLSALRVRRCEAVGKNGRGGASSVRIWDVGWGMWDVEMKWTGFDMDAACSLFVFSAHGCGIALRCIGGCSGFRVQGLVPVACSAICHCDTPVTASQHDLLARQTYCLTIPSVPSPTQGSLRHLA